MELKSTSAKWTWLSTTLKTLTYAVASLYIVSMIWPIEYTTWSPKLARVGSIPNCFSVSTRHGDWRFTLERNFNVGPNPRLDRAYLMSYRNQRYWFVGIGFVHTVDTWFNEQIMTLYTHPAWLIVMFGIYPASRCFLIRLKLANRGRRIARGLCPHCEYNLAGNTSGRCPECGEVAN